MATTIIRSPKDKQNPYFMMRRDTAQDSRLSFQARGMLAYLFSKPGDWDIKLTDLQNAGGCGRDRVNRILNELAEYGYFERIRIRDEKTKKFKSIEYILREQPRTEKPYVAKPEMEKPKTENPAHTKDRDSTENRNNKDSADAATPVSVEVVEGGEKSEPETQVVKEPEDKPGRPRDLIFEAVIERGFKVELDNASAVEAIRDKANWITSWCKGNAVKKHSKDKDKSLPGCSPALTPEGIHKFLDYMDEKHPDIEFTTPIAWAKYVGMARKELRGNGCVSTPRRKADPNCKVCHGAGVVQPADADPVRNPVTIPCPRCMSEAVAS